MLETKEQKTYLVTILVLVVILSVISFWHKPNYQYKDTADYGKLAQQQKQQQQDYQQYLASIKTDPAASQQLLKNVLPQAEVQAAVEKALDANQKVDYPVIADSEVRIANKTGKETVGKYMLAAGGYFDRLKGISDAVMDDLYNPSGSVDKINKAIIESENIVTQFSQLSVPKEAVVFHKAELVNLYSYLDLIKTSKSYTTKDIADPWPKTFRNYLIIDKNNKAAIAAYEQLNQKYDLTAYLSKADPAYAKGNFFIPAAQAQWVVVDVWQKAQEIFWEVVSTTVARFMLSFMDTLAQKIEETYRISNFLYYTDALVNGQYVDDYLNKYVNDPLDRIMVKNFIPEISCGNPAQNLKPVFQAKASQYLGFDPAALDPSDPNYYQKLSDVGSFLSSPTGWDLYYRDIAAQADAKAQSAANSELSSPGTKASRDITGSIIQPAEVSISALRSIFQAYLDEGDATRGFTATEKITSQITQEFLNRFLFKGAVYKEQKVCLSVPQVRVVIAPPSGIMPSVPTQQSVLAQQCSDMSVLTSDCTSATLGELQLCAQNATGNQNPQQYCSKIANSSYINTLLQQCRQAPTGICTQLQNLLKVVH